MCLAKAYMAEAENEIVLEDIARLKIEGNKINLATLFGEQKEIEGTLKMIDFQGAKIVIESAA